jgi:hypothetical protein
MKFRKAIPFNSYKIDGYMCSCGEIYFDSEQAQKVLLLNKLKKEKIKAKLGKIKSNLILRVPKDIETALGFEQGNEVELTIENNELRVRAI